MTEPFTTDDLEKPVENAAGEVIGTVEAIDDDIAFLDTSAGLVDSVRATLCWNGDRDDTVTIHARDVDEVSSTMIRLECDSEE